MNKDSQVIYGVQTVLESLRSGKNLEQVYMKNELRGPLVKSLKQELIEAMVPISIVPQVRLNKFTSKNHQGVVGKISPIPYHNLGNLVQKTYEKGEVPLLIILDKITDVRNFGAIARTAESQGVHGIIIPTKGGVRINADAMKTSAGTLNYLPVCRVNDLTETILYLKSCGLNVISSSENAKKLPYEIDLTCPLAIVLGSEDTGITKSILDLSDHKIKIEMFGKVKSINVSVANGILLYEVQRQRCLNILDHSS